MVSFSQKTALFKLGARPVTYGLSGDVNTSIDSAGARTIASAQLPPREQYRYVTYKGSCTVRCKAHARSLAAANHVAMLQEDEDR
jgi:hypothetical protein